MVVDRNTDGLFGFLLANDVGVEVLLDFFRKLEGEGCTSGCGFFLLAQNAIGLLDAMVTDVARNAGNQDVNVFFAAPAE